MKWHLRTPRVPRRELSEEELDELGRALFQAADAAPISPRADAIRTRLLDSLNERQPRLALVPAMLVAVLVAVIGVGAAVGTQSIGSLIPPPVRTFLDDLLRPELTPPLLPPTDDEYAGPDAPDTPDTPGDDAPGDVDPPDGAGPPQRPVMQPTPVPAGPPATTPTPAAGEGPPNWVPVRGPPAPPPVVTPPPPPTPPQTGPPGDTGP